MRECHRKRQGTQEGQEVSLSEMVKVKSWSAVGKGFLERWGRRDAEPQRVSLKPEPEVRRRRKTWLVLEQAPAPASPGSASRKRVCRVPCRVQALYASLHPPIDLCSEYCFIPISRARTWRHRTCSLPRITQLGKVAELNQSPGRRPPGRHP